MSRYRIHAGGLDGDTHAHGLFVLLKERGWRGATGREIRDALDCTSPGSAAAELRSNGFRVPTRLERTTDAGRKVYRYWLLVRDMQEFDRRMRKRAKAGATP